MALAVFHECQKLARDFAFLIEEGMQTVPENHYSGNYFYSNWHSKLILGITKII